GLCAVVVFTDVDRDAPFVRHADAAVRLPAPAGEVRAYLHHDLVIAALRRAGADAVWPGWGFVAEDPVFADRVVAEGMRFLGPSGDAMRALGHKIAAKQLAERAGVPVTPWSGAAVDDEAAAARSAERLGYPLVAKAAAGGGGRGIRMVERAAATRLGREVGYVGLGTVEFLVAGADAYFLEMNPRLQVEHGITEAITGLDLVQLQIRIARGERLASLEACERGVAIEARVCAEDPDAAFVPSPGRIARFDPALGP